MNRFQFVTLILLASQHLITCNNPLNCNPNSESLFVEDPTDRQAFFSCKPYVNYPSIGFWSRHYCPNDMHFEYSSQQCTTDTLPPNTVREANDLLQLAILNGSCAHGEQCIGGTVCDPVQQRCLCPYGTVALLENLFCAKLIPSVGTTLQQQFSYGGQYYSSQVPLSSQGTSTSSPFVNSLVPIGSYCDQEGICDGGSTCVNSVCVCPAKTKNNGNNCTTSLSNFSNIPSSTSGQQQLTKELYGQKTFFRAKLGEQCNEYLGLFCADQSSLCFNGYCQCIPPMIEQQGQCQMPPTREAAPGELCNSGQVCVGGSVCNQQVPLCVCPKETELVKGRCVERNLERASKEEKIEDKLSSSSTESTYSHQNKLRPSKLDAKVGEKCSLNADCASGAYCNGNTQPPTCQCLSTHISVHDHCEKVIYPGQKGCETDLQCSAGYAGARCLNGHCVCPPGSSALEQTCIPAIAWPGEACNISHLIPVCSADSYCFEGFCVCNPPLSLFQKQCINLKKNFEEESKKEGKIKVKRRRLHLEEFGGNFDDKKIFKNEVLRNKVEEKNGKNLFKNSLKNSKKFSKRIFKKSKRRRKRKLKEEKEQQQKQNERKGKIMPKISPTFRLIGSKCNENIDHCSAGADCLNSKCVCLEGSFPDAQKRYCRQYPGKSCAKGQMCTDRSDCLFGKCKCRRGLELQFFGNFSKCGEPKKKNVKMPLTGHLCVNNECTTGAKCLNGICTCLEGYNLFHGECLPPRASLSGTNTFHEHSLLFSPNFPLMDSSTFEIKYKEKKDDLSEEDPLPTKTVVAGAPCRLSLECPYRTECLRGVCRCKQGETIINGVCRKAIHEVLPGGRCDTQNGVDCIGESHCFYGICVCLYGLVITGQECVNSSLMKAVRPGGRCILGQRCTGRSRCVRSICRCPQGQKADISGDKGCINPSTTETNSLKPKKYETKMDDENQEIDEEDGQKLPKFVYTIPAALAAAGERGKYNQILTANQMSINLMDSKTLRSLFGPLLKHSLRRESGEEEIRSFGGCKGPNCRVHSFPKFVSPPKSSASSVLAVGPPSHLDTSNSKNLPETPTSPFGIPGTHCGVSTNGQSTTCSGGAICLGGICVCRPGFRPLNGLCQISKVELGERCFINEQCKNNGFCINGICHCRYDQQNIKPDDNLNKQINFFHSQKCANRLLASVGDDCTKGQKCGFNSICGKYSGVCECPIGMERNEGICIAAKRPRGTQCFSSSDCNFHSFCDNGFCICLAEYYPIGSNCLPPALAVGEDPRAYIDPDLLALILKQGGNKVNDEQMERQNIEGKNINDAELSEKWKWKREVPKPFESEKLSLPSRTDQNYFEEKLCCQQAEDQSGKEFSSNKNNKTSLTQSKLPQLSTSLMKGNEETFASETISSALPNYAPEMLREENEKEQKMTAAPGAQCGPLDICTGGSTCVEGLCLCPAGTRPSVKSENCETFEQRKSSIQQEQNKKEYSKYANKIPRMQPGPIGRPYARPSESCANREICTGGSVCQNSNKICECPPNKSILRNHICIQSDEPPMLRVVHAFPGDKCNSETNCERESVCVEGTCRCQNNDFTPKSGNCTKRSVIETPASVQSPSTFEAIDSDYDNILPPVQLPEEGSSLEVQHPRISGPPLKKHSSSSSSLISNILPQLTKNEPPIKGVCPPGNSPTISRSTGQIIKCNGMTPNCPPKSYCFVTGDASETYNCCKSY